MPELSAQLPAIIGEAAKSPLGIFALMIISLAILGFFFFKEASEKTRIAIFSMLFVGVAVFGLSIVRTTSAAAADAGTETPAAGPAEDALVESILGMWTADVIYFRPRSFQETFTFEMIGDRLMVTPTFQETERTGLNVRTGNGLVEFEIQRQEIAGEVTTNIVTSYIGAIHPDRIDFTVTHTNNDPRNRFQARRVDSR